MHEIYHLIQNIMRFASRLEPQQWVIILGVMIVIGLICLRGFGSRSKY